MGGIVASVIVLAVGAGVAAWAGWAGRFGRLLHRTPRTLIAEARAGSVVIAGQVGVADTVLHAPLTGRRCVAYEITRHEGSRGAPGQLQERRGVDFFVRDPTGKARILLGQAQDFQLLLERSAIVKGARELQAAGFDSALLVRWRAVEYERLFDDVVLVERILPTDGRALVAGPGVWEADPSPDASSVTAGYRDFPRLLLVGRDGERALVVSDRV